jgi:hypothetical protein
MWPRRPGVGQDDGARCDGAVGRGRDDHSRVPGVCGVNHGRWCSDPAGSDQGRNAVGAGGIGAIGEIGTAIGISRRQLDFPECTETRRLLHGRGAASCRNEVNCIVIGIRDEIAPHRARE